MLLQSKTNNKKLKLLIDKLKKKKYLLVTKFDKFMIALSNSVQLINYTTF